MSGEILTGLSVFKTLLDLAKGLKDVNDAAARNSAVIELQEKILAAQETHFALIERVRELEKHMAELETWETEKQRYELKDFGGETFAYVLKPEMSGPEPPHKICAKCYQKRYKSILQFQGQNSYRQSMYSCFECNTHFDLGAADYNAAYRGHY